MKKIIDGKGRLFGVVSVIDLLVVLVAVVLAAAVYNRFFTAGEVTVNYGEDDAFTYVMCVEGVRQYTVDMIREGDKLYAADGGMSVGTIRKIEVVPANRDIIISEGRYVNADMPERYDMIITVDAKGLVTNGQYYASRTYEISANGNVYYCNRYVVGGGRVWSVEPA